ncbi:hypothetical protein P7C73_g4122, partial [Tremellales sp. Uapishka_1]
MHWYPIAAAIAFVLAYHGYHKGSLSTSGALAAFVVGYGHLACPLKLFGASMIGFYLIASRATKIKIQVKAQLEDGINATKPSGNRNVVQVLSNSLPSLLCALVYRASQAGDVSTSSQTVSRKTNPDQLSQAHYCLPLTPVSRVLIFGALGHFSNCLADTLASEYGILAPSPPRYILSLKPVPPGTNGGISILGLLASVLGGLDMAAITIVDLYIENPPCRSAGMGWVLELLVFGILAGLGGSLLDSLLGALFQKTLYSSKTNKIITDTSDMSQHNPADLQTIGYGRDILSNSGVNFICGWIMALSGYWWSSR